ncbi:hypothetical protein [Chitinophaga sp.]|uniref:hypothetical protein n=1 Tax=Chitinophaga sp. TaxID=1869181 RepID=UPI0031D83875
MSYEYFLQAHLNQGAQEVPTERILSIFSDYIIVKDKTFIDVRFDESNSCTVYMDTEEAYNTGLMVSRPCGGKLGACLYAVMRLGNFVFYEPDGVHVLVVNAAVIPHLPEDMITALGMPVVGETLDKFLELYNNNR